MVEPIHSAFGAAPEPSAGARRKVLAAVARTAARGPRAIEARLRELDREWDFDRCVVEARAVAAAASGLALGLIDRIGIKAPRPAFLLEGYWRQIAPPAFVLRAFGVRSAAEVELERASLRAARGVRAPAPVAGTAGFSRARADTASAE